MALTLTQVRNALDCADTVGKNKEGSIVVRRGFFYRGGMSGERFANTVVTQLQAAGFECSVVKSGEHWASFKAGATVAQSSHWFVELV
jgi:hypothetical protein